MTGKGEQDGKVKAAQAAIVPSAEQYAALAAPFEHTFERQGLTYITGEQCVSRLNDVLGYDMWSFTIKEHGIHAEADEVWALGELTVYVRGGVSVSLSEGVTYRGHVVVRQQFGSNKIKRSRSSGAPLDLGFDLKGAATDALKKCASLVGVALYLSAKDDPVTRPATEGGGQGAPTPAHGGGPIVCETCQAELGEIRFRDGTAWLPAQLANLGKRKHGRVLCMDHYRQANEARRRTEMAAADPNRPF